MTDTLRCSSCGRPLDPDAPAGLCPTCLLKLGVAETMGPSEGETLGPSEVGTVMGASDAGTRLGPLTPMPGGRRTAPAINDTIGPFRLIEKLGEGGMGVVYLAEQTVPLKRRVAVKVIKVGMDTREVVARFEAERQTLALMDHPNIAHVYDAGATADGRPYFVMEYVSGAPLTEYCDTHRLSTRARLELFVHVCTAIQHAHQKGVIHRDLKPSNVIVAEQDGRAMPKVIDFGIAKATEASRTEQTMFTEQGLMVGTPEYMSPEQAAASPDIDTTTDVYSLGVLLYELLVGELPFDPKTLRAAGYDEMRRIIRESDPPKPSTRFSSLGDTAKGIANKRQTDAGPLTRHLKGDLDWITLKALQKDRRRRYPTVAAFSADVERYLGHEPIVARPPSRGYRIQKFVRRNRLAVSAASLVVLALAVGLVASTILYRQAERQRAVAESARQDADSQRTRAQGEANAAIAARNSENAARQRAERGEYEATIRVADLHIIRNAPGDAIRELSRVQASMRNLEWRYLWNAADSSRTTLRPDPKRRRGAVDQGALAFPLGGQTVVLVGRMVWAWDRSNGKLIWIDRPTVDYQITFAVSRDGRLVAHESSRGGMAVSRTDDGKEQIHLGTGSSGTCAAFSSDGKRLATATSAGLVKIWRTDQTAPPNQLPTSPAGSTPAPRAARLGDCALEFSPDDKRVLVSGASAVVWDVETQRQVAAVADATWGVFNRDGRQLVLTMRDGAVQIRSLEDAGRPQSVGVRARSNTRWLSLSPDGRLLATASAGSSDVTVWDVRTGLEIAWLHHDDSVEGVIALAFTPDGTELLAARRFGSVTVWSSAAFSRASALLTGSDEPTTVAISDDEKLVAAGDGDGTVRVWTLPDITPVAELRGHKGPVSALRFDARNRIVSGSEDHTIRLWDVRTRKLVRSFEGHTDLIASLAVSEDGRSLASASWDGTVRIWNTESGKETGRFSCGAQAKQVAFDESGAVIAAGGGFDSKLGGFNGPLTVCTEKEVLGRSAAAGGDPLTFLPNRSGMLASNGVGGPADLWSIDLKTKLATLNGHLMTSWAAAATADGSRLVTLSLDKTMRIWATETGALLVTVVVGRPGSPNSLALSRSGRYMVAAVSGMQEPAANPLGGIPVIRFWDLSIDRAAGPAAEKR